MIIVAFGGINAEDIQDGSIHNTRYYALPSPKIHQSVLSADAIPILPHQVAHSDAPQKKIYSLEEQKQTYPLEEEKQIYPLEEEQIYPLKEEKQIYPLQEEKQIYPLEEEKQIYPLDEDKITFPPNLENNDISSNFKPSLLLSKSSFIPVNLKPFEVSQKSNFFNLDLQLQASDPEQKVQTYPDVSKKQIFPVLPQKQIYPLVPHKQIYPLVEEEQFFPLRLEREISPSFPLQRVKKIQPEISKRQDNRNLNLSNRPNKLFSTRKKRQSSSSRKPPRFFPTHPPLFSLNHSPRFSPNRPIRVRSRRPRVKNRIPKRPRLRDTIPPAFRTGPLPPVLVTTVIRPRKVKNERKQNIHHEQHTHGIFPHQNVKHSSFINAPNTETENTLPKRIPSSSELNQINFEDGALISGGISDDISTPNGNTFGIGHLPLESRIFSDEDELKVNKRRTRESIFREDVEDKFRTKKNEEKEFDRPLFDDDLVKEGDKIEKFNDNFNENEDKFSRPVFVNHQIKENDNTATHNNNHNNDFSINNNREESAKKNRNLRKERFNKLLRQTIDERIKNRKKYIPKQTFSRENLKDLDKNRINKEPPGLSKENQELFLDFIKKVDERKNVPTTDVIPPFSVSKHIQFL